jgi:hypothetical protein
MSETMAIRTGLIRKGLLEEGARVHADALQTWVRRLMVEAAYASSSVEPSVVQLAAERCRRRFRLRVFADYRARRLAARPTGSSYPGIRQRLTLQPRNTSSCENASHTR